MGRNQRDSVRRLRYSAIKRVESAKLSKCAKSHCGCDPCNAACWFGSRRQRQQHLPAILRLFRRRKEPVLEVRLVCGDWSRRRGQLHTANIARARRRIRTLFDSLFNPTIVAVGSFKVAAAANSAQRWIFEAHLLVAGVEAKDLEELLTEQRPGLWFDNFWLVKPAKDVDAVARRILRRDLLYWIPPVHCGDDRQRMSNALRTELYAWLFGWKLSDLTIRYGCDRHYRHLAKKPRRYQRKGTRKRIYPTWLIPHMFGGQKWDHKPEPDPSAYKPKARLVEAPADYYDDFDSDCTTSRSDSFDDLDSL